MRPAEELEREIGALRERLARYIEVGLRINESQLWDDDAPQRVGTEEIFLRKMATRRVLTERSR